jgi:hypothetical protein
MGLRRSESKVSSHIRENKYKSREGDSEENLSRREVILDQLGSKLESLRITAVADLVDPLLIGQANELLGKVRNYLNHPRNLNFIKQAKSEDNTITVRFKEGDIKEIQLLTVNNNTWQLRVVMLGSPIVMKIRGRSLVDFNDVSSAIYNPLP